MNDYESLQPATKWTTRVLYLAQGRWTVHKCAEFLNDLSFFIGDFGECSGVARLKFIQINEKVDD